MFGRKKAEIRLANERTYWSGRIRKEKERADQAFKGMRELNAALEMIMASVVDTFGENGKVFIPRNTSGKRASVHITEDGYILEETDGDKTQGQKT